MKPKSLRNYLFTGLVVWLPIIITLMVLGFIVDMLDGTIALLPAAYQPQQLIGMRIPGLGVLVSLVLLFITGMVATNFFGQRLVASGEALLGRIPLVRSIYTTAKQIIQAIFATNSQAFRKVLLIEYPRQGSWSLAFLTGNSHPEVLHHTNEELLSVYVPTTPNPTSGFLLMIPKKNTIELSMTTDEALKYIISLGVMQSSSLLHLEN